MDLADIRKEANPLDIELRLGFTPAYFSKAWEYKIGECRFYIVKTKWGYEYWWAQGGDEVAPTLEEAEKELLANIAL